MIALLQLQRIFRLFQAMTERAEGPAPADPLEAGLRPSLLPPGSIYNTIILGSLALVVVLIATFGGQTQLPVRPARRPEGDLPGTANAATTGTRHSMDPVAEVQGRVRD